MPHTPCINRASSAPVLRGIGERNSFYMREMRVGIINFDPVQSTPLQRGRAVKYGYFYGHPHRLACVCQRISLALRAGETPGRPAPYGRAVEAGISCQVDPPTALSVVDNEPIIRRSTPADDARFPSPHRQSMARPSARRKSFVRFLFAPPSDRKTAMKP